MEKEANKNYPGYPHYPADEDITRAKNNNGKETIEAVNKPKQPYNDTVDERDNDVSIVPGTEADVNAEDLRILEAAEQNMDTMDDSNLQHAALDNVDDDGDPLNEESSLNIDMTGESLDVPGSSDDDADEDIGEEDEENNYYSQGDND